MTKEEAAALKELRQAAEALTPQNIDSAELTTDGIIECPVCQGEGEVESTAYCNYDKAPIGVHFYGIGQDHQNAERFFRLARPQVLLPILDALSPKIFLTRWNKGISVAFRMGNQTFTLVRLQGELPPMEEANWQANMLRSAFGQERKAPEEDHLLSMFNDNEPL